MIGRKILPSCNRTRWGSRRAKPAALTRKTVERPSFFRSIASIRPKGAKAARIVSNAVSHSAAVCQTCRETGVLNVRVGTSKSRAVTAMPSGTARAATSRILSASGASGTSWAGGRFSMPRSRSLAIRGGAGETVAFHPAPTTVTMRSERRAHRLVAERGRDGRLGRGRHVHLHAVGQQRPHRPVGRCRRPQGQPGARSNSDGGPPPTAKRPGHAHRACRQPRQKRPIGRLPHVRRPIGDRPHIRPQNAFIFRKGTEKWAAIVPRLDTANRLAARASRPARCTAK